PCSRSVYRAAVFFLFSRRRRHTRSSRDWSSDVCSSDLEGEPLLLRRERSEARNLGSGLAEQAGQAEQGLQRWGRVRVGVAVADEDRKSTRLNSSHVKISYAVFCLKKKKKG